MHYLNDGRYIWLHLPDHHIRRPFLYEISYSDEVKLVVDADKRNISQYCGTNAHAIDIKQLCMYRHKYADVKP